MSLVALFRTFGAVIGFVAGILITRNLGIKESGLYFYAIDLITAIALIAGLGLHNGLLRDVAADNADSTYAAQKFWGVIKFVSLTSFVSIVVVSTQHTQIAEFVSKEKLSYLLLILSILIFLLPLNSYLVTYLQSKKRLIESSLLQFVLPYTLLSILVLIIKPTDSILTAYLHLLIIVSTSVVGLLLTKKQLFTPRATEKSHITGWQSFITMHLFSSLSVMLISVINGYFLLPEEFAILTAANRYTLLISFCLIAFNFVAAPQYARLYQQKKLGELATFAQYITRCLIIITIPCSIIVILFKNQFMSLYGDEFTEYGYILAILVAGQIVNVATGSVAYLLTLSGHEKDLKNIIIILTPISVLLSFILANVWGLTGVAVAMAISAININILAYIMVVKRLGFHTIKFSFNKAKE